MLERLAPSLVVVVPRAISGGVTVDRTTMMMMVVALTIHTSSLGSDPPMEKHHWDEFALDSRIDLSSMEETNCGGGGGCGYEGYATSDWHASSIWKTIGSPETSTWPKTNRCLPLESVLDDLERITQVMWA